MDAVRVSSWDPVGETFLLDATAPRGEIIFRGGNAMIQHCRIEHLGYASASRQTHGLTVVNCTDVRIYDNTIIGGFQGINIQYSSGVVARGNVIEEPFDTGILIENGSTSCDLVSNIINASGRHGIMIFDRCTDLRVTLNTLSNNMGHGIKVFKWCHDLDINQNIAKDNYRKAIAVFACNDLKISDNIAINGTGIFVSHKSDGIEITANRLINTTTAIALIGTSDDPQTISEAIDVSYEEFEIYSEYNIIGSMYGDVTYCAVEKNDIRGCQNEGIKLYKSHHNKVKHNTITGSEKYGIQLIGSWHNRFLGNEIDQVGKAKYSAIDNSYGNHIVKHGTEYTLTDRGCVVSAVDVNEDGCVNLNELGLMSSYIIESIRRWF
jgi:parallel beta-helix repeat protein